MKGSRPDFVTSERMNPPPSTPTHEPSFVVGFSSIIVNHHRRRLLSQTSSLSLVVDCPITTTAKIVSSVATSHTEHYTSFAFSYFKDCQDETCFAFVATCGCVGLFGSKFLCLAFPWESVRCRVVSFMTPKQTDIFILSSHYHSCAGRLRHRRVPRVVRCA